MRVIGVELSQDIEEITLDRTLEDLQATEVYLGQMLASISKKAGIDNLMDVNFNPEALQSSDSDVRGGSTRLSQYLCQRSRSVCG